MIDVHYTLHGDDGEIRYEEKKTEHVPRAGELVTFNSDHSYEVVDVLWHLTSPAGHHVTVTACELDWHRHIRDVLACGATSRTLLDP